MSIPYQHIPQHPPPQHTPNTHPTHTQHTAPPLTEPEKQSPKSPYEAVDTVVAVKQQARISPKKLNLIARLVRGMSAHDAVLQCAVSDKKGGRIALELLKNALEDAKNKGMDVNQLVVGVY